VFAIYNYDNGERLRTFTTESFSNGKRGFGYAWCSQAGSLFRIVDKEITVLEMSNTGAVVNGESINYENTVPFSYSDLLIFNQFVLGLFWPSCMKLYNFEVPSKCSLLPAIDSSGTPCMHDTVSGQNFYNADTSEGAAPFIVGFDTTKKAAVSLSKLPIKSGGTLTVSLPAEAENTDTLVPAAIDLATSRGWTIVTQYRTN
jgi:hypothetical protein